MFKFLPALCGSIFSVLTFILKEQFVFFSRRTLKELFVFFPFGLLRNSLGFFPFWTLKERFLFFPIFGLKGFFTFCNLRSYSPVPPVAPSPLSRPGRLLYKSSQVGAVLCLGCLLGSSVNLNSTNSPP